MVCLLARNVDVRYVWQGRHDWHGCYGRHQRQFDTRTGVFDVWNIRAYLWQFRLLHRFYFGRTVRSLWIWLLRSLRFCRSSGVTGTAGTLASGSSGRAGIFERSGLFTRSPNPPSGIRIGLTGIFGFTVTGFSGCFGAVYVGGV